MENILLSKIFHIILPLIFLEIMRPFDDDNIKYTIQYNKIKYTIQ